MSFISLFLLAHLTSAKDQIDDCTKLPTDGNNVNTITDVSTIEWPAAMQFTLQQEDKCWFIAKMTSYAWWELGTELHVQIEQLEHDTTAGNDECKSTGIIETYIRNDLLQTSRTEFPYNRDHICGYNYTFINLNADTTEDVTIYTLEYAPKEQYVPIGAAFGLRSYMVASLVAIVASNIL